MAEDIIRKIDISAVVGQGYGTFWRYRGRYRVVKGGRRAKKSATAALWYIYHLMKYPKANLLVVRRYANGHRDSTWAQLRWAAKRLGVAHLWRSTRTPLALEYLPTGQKILFRGMDDPESIHSITVERGYLCWVWIEEAFQIEEEGAFNKLDMSIRGDMEEGYFKQLTLTFNPWSGQHWLKERFFDRDTEEVLALTKTYLDNEFLDEHDRRLFEEMKQCFPRRYDVEGLGQWGIASGLVYENWRVEAFDWKDLAMRRTESRILCGLDFGFTHDPTAFIICVVDEGRREIYVFDEIYRKAMLNSDIADAILSRGYGKYRIVADSAEPKSIAELKRLGLTKVTGAKKGPDSLRHGIQRLCGYTLIVHPRCVHTKEELESYVWQEHNGVLCNTPIDRNNHLMDALRYATEGLDRNIFVLK